MSRIDYRTLVNWGRKAGLQTQEIYQAMTSRTPEGSDRAIGQADGNGFETQIDESGKRIYRPVGRNNRT